MNHSEAEELLPWFAAGTLEARETSAVEAHVVDCERCATELHELGHLLDAVAEQGAEEPAYNPEILTAALKQIDAMVARDEQEITVREAPGRSGLRALLQNLVEKLQWSLTPPMARIAIGAQFVLALGLGLVLAFGAGENDERGAYGVVGMENQGDYTLGFAPGVTELQIRTLLLESNATIIAGPSSLGFYVIDIDNSSDETAAIAKIRASGLSAFLEPVPRSSLEGGPNP